MERGYGGTTIEAIAERLAWHQKPFMPSLKNKRNVLSFLFDISIGGDDEDIRLLDRPDPQAVTQETDQRRQLNLFARISPGSCIVLLPSLKSCVLQRRRSRRSTDSCSVFPGADRK